MNRFSWLIRREFWEHRAIWVAPAIVLAILLLGAVTGNVFIGNVNLDHEDAAERSGLTEQDIADLRELKRIASDESLSEAEKAEKLKKFEDLETRLDHLEHVSPDEALALIPAEKRAKLVTVVYVAVTAVMFMVLGTIGFFYALDSLYADRRDRSVLFWKSLPLSDTETVASKFAVGVVAIPLVAAVAAILAQLVVAVGITVKGAIAGNDVGVMWDGSVLGASMLLTGVVTAASILWYAPLVAYLMLASAWAPKSPFLWAILPPMALVLLEKIAFGTNALWQFITYRVFGVVKALFGDESQVPGVVIRRDELMQGTGSGIVELFGSTSMLLGLVAAAALVAVTVWVRRYRDETI